MSSAASDSTDPGVTNAPAGPSRSSVALVVFSLALLAALVWALRPDRPNFQPAPLQPPPNGCPKQQVFVPSNVTQLPDSSLEELSPRLKNRALLRMNMEPCPCGCGASVALCRVNNPSCEASKEVAKRIIAEVQAEIRH